MPTSIEFRTFMQSIGFSPVAAAGITGNIVEETGNFLPSVISGKRLGDSGTAFGLMQWRHERQDKLKSFAKSIGRDVLDWKTQALFIKAEMVDPNYQDPGSVRAYNELQSAETVEQAVAAFLHAERPKGYTSKNPAAALSYNKRLSHAKVALSGKENTVRGSNETDESYNERMKGLGVTGDAYDSYTKQAEEKPGYGRKGFELSDFGAKFDPIFRPNGNQPNFGPNMMEVPPMAEGDFGVSPKSPYKFKPYGG